MQEVLLLGLLMGVCLAAPTQRAIVLPWQGADFTLTDRNLAKRLPGAVFLPPTDLVVADNHPLDAARFAELAAVEGEGAAGAAAEMRSIVDALPLVRTAEERGPRADIHETLSLSLVKAGETADADWHAARAKSLRGEPGEPSARIDLASTLDAPQQVLVDGLPVTVTPNEPFVLTQGATDIVFVGPHGFGLQERVQGQLRSDLSYFIQEKAMIDAQKLAMALGNADSCVAPSAMSEAVGRYAALHPDDDVLLMVPKDGRTKGDNLQVWQYVRDRDTVERQGCES